MSSAATLYGIKQCTTVRKARAWLDAHRIAYQFHDFKSAGITRERIESWLEHVDWSTLLNRSGTTFRGLTKAQQQHLTRAKALELMLAKPTLIKRPVLEWRGRVLVGFRETAYAEWLGD